MAHQARGTFRECGDAVRCIGIGKSFLALDIAAAVVRGVPWRGFKTLQGEVAYFVAEGAGGFRQRIRAYIEHNGPEAAQALRAGLRIHEDGPNLLVESDVKAFIEVLRAEGSPRLVIIDTLAQATPARMRTHPRTWAWRRTAARSSPRKQARWSSWFTTPARMLPKERGAGRASRVRWTWNLK
ncbi:MAG: AAA family ATPase [Thiobacillus sp.]|nr:MAG: AAA family ATPase [Thiobacillus sp.]